MSTPRLSGIHHVTAICGDPQRNVDFYVDLLGLRLVKLTVNFDDPGAYHLYYGDEAGRPGTILTFFAWPGAPRGQRGSGQLVAASLSIPEPAMGYWLERFQHRGIAFERPTTRFDEEVVSFFDPDGLQLELVADGSEGQRPFWEEGPVPAENAVRGFSGVTLAEPPGTPTAAMLVDQLGFRDAGADGRRRRYVLGKDEASVSIDVVEQGGPAGQIAVGTIHHVAWRAGDDEAQIAWREWLREAGVDVTPVRDRQYFRSIYFHEPGGVVFEIATDPPGFTTDEPIESLGTELKLPPWLESRREQTARSLPPLRLPAT